MAAQPTFYTYRITHVSGRFYFGSRTSQVAPDLDLWRRYFTSSKEVLRMIAEDSPASFTAEVLDSYPTHDECYWAEQRLIKQAIKDPLNLNRFYVDPDSRLKKFSTAGVKDTAEQRAKKSAIHRGLPKPHTPEQNRRIGDALRGVPKKPHTEMFKNNMSRTLTGLTAWVVNSNGAKKIKTVDLEAHLSDGYHRGRVWKEQA